MPDPTPDPTIHADPTPASPRKRKKRRSLLFKVGIAHLILLGLILLLNITGRALLHAELQALEQAGYPKTWQEWTAQFPEVKDSENAALLYLRAAEGMQYGIESGPIPEGEISTAEGMALMQMYNASSAGVAPEVLMQIEKLLELNKETLALMDQAATLSQSRYPVDYSKDTPLISSFGSIRHLNDLLGLRVLAQLSRGEHDGAAQTIHTMIQLSESLTHDVMLLGVLVQRSMQKPVFQAIQAGMVQRAWSGDQLIAFEQELQAMEHVEAMQVAFDAIAIDARQVCEIDARELGYYVSIFGQYVSEDDPSVSRNRILLTLYGLSGLRAWDEFFGVRAVRKSSHAARLPLEQRTMYAVDSHDMAFGMAGYLPLTPIIAGSLQVAVSRDVSAIRDLRLARIVLACERYRLATGSLPARTEDLIPTYLPEPIENPLDGKPFPWTDIQAEFPKYRMGQP